MKDGKRGLQALAWAWVALYVFVGTEFECVFILSRVASSNGCMALISWYPSSLLLCLR